MTLVSFPRYLRKLPRRTRAILATCLYGLSAGVAAVAFQWCMSALFDATYGNLKEKSFGVFLAGSFVVVMVSSLIVGYLLNFFCREASGSGIPQLKLAFWKEFGYMPWRVVWVKFLAGIISIGGGASLGREGPSVHFGGALASNIAGWMGEAKQNRRSAAAAGAAAGLAAAFNTPLAAITFVLEEVIQDLNSRFLGGVLLASVMGALIVHGLIGQQPAFTVASVGTVSWRAYGLVPVVSAISSLVGLLFQRATLRLRAARQEFRHVPYWMRPCLGGLATWILGCTVFWYTHSLGVFGLGYDDLSRALSPIPGQDFAWQLAAILVVAKLLATIACYGFGGSGGVFSPLLFLGGMAGVVVAGLFGLAMPLSTPDRILLAVVGMSGCLGAVVKAPVTSILIVFEMTHEFSLVPVLMVGTLVSQALSIKLAKHNFYEALLIQDGHNLEHVVPPRDLQSWQQLPVSAISNFQPVAMRDLSTKKLQEITTKHPYKFFPVIIDGSPPQMLSRREATAALAENRAPRLEPAVTCTPSQRIGELQMLLIESNQGVVLLVDRPGGNVIGLVTLHDLLRAEVSMVKESSSGSAQ